MRTLSSTFAVVLITPCLQRHVEVCMFVYRCGELRLRFVTLGRGRPLKRVVAQIAEQENVDVVLYDEAQYSI